VQSDVGRSLDSAQPGNIRAQERPEAAAAAQTVHSLLASIPVLEWFVRSPPPPEDAPSTARSRRRNLISRAAAVPGLAGCSVCAAGAAQGSAGPQRLIWLLRLRSGHVNRSQRLDVAAAV